MCNTSKLSKINIQINKLQKDIETAGKPSVRVSMFFRKFIISQGPQKIIVGERSYQQVSALAHKYLSGQMTPVVIYFI